MASGLSEYHGSLRLLFSESDIDVNLRHESDHSDLELNAPLLWNMNDANHFLYTSSNMFG